jgi:6-phosphogluconolactonase
VIALSGGSTPGPVYERWATRWRDDTDWSAVVVLWGDDRCVPPDDAESNYRLARESLLSRVPIPESRIHRMRGELEPARAADDYERVLRALGADRPDAPLLDLAHQGVGSDGHTASLFPGSEALEERDRLALAVQAPEGVTPRDRITLTLPLLNAAREVHVLATGEEKRLVVQRVARAPDEAATRYPAARLRGRERTLWMVDAAAGA